MRRDDAGVSSVVGALIVLAVLGASLVYVNAYHVPKKGASLEVAARDEMEAALQRLAGDLASPGAGPLVADVPLRGEAPPPPLLSGVVLSPARGHGRLSFDTEGPRITLSHVTAAPAGGVAPGDPTRAPLPDGRARVYNLGNAASGAPVGALTLTTPSAYLEGANYSLEGGAVVAKRGGGSMLLSPPPLHVARGGTPTNPTTTVSWRVPLLAGAGVEVGGGERAQVSLLPGPVSLSGGGQLVHGVTVRVETDALAAWKSALEDLVGPHGVVTTHATGPDRGVVTADILPPAGTPAGARAVELRLQAVRYEVGLAERGVA